MPREIEQIDIVQDISKAFAREPYLIMTVTEIDEENKTEQGTSRSTDKMVEDADPEVRMDTLLAQASRNRSQTTNPPGGKPRSSISNSLI